MSTRPFHPDDLVPYVAAMLLRDAPHQRDLYGASVERIHGYIRDTGYMEGGDAFLAANAAAYGIRYREEATIPEWTEAQSAAVARLVQVGGLSVGVLAQALREIGLLRYNLDDSATMEALDFCLGAAKSLCWLVARPDVRAAAER